MGWYCPKCGSTVALVNGVWRCGGGLDFSIDLGKRLTAAYEAGHQPGKIPDCSPGVNVLFCPACVSQLDPDGRCWTCGRSFKEFVYAMIEYHPHPGSTGGWF